MTADGSPLDAVLSFLEMTGAGAGAGATSAEDMSEAGMAWAGADVVGAATLVAKAFAAIELCAEVAWRDTDACSDALIARRKKTVGS